MAAMTRMGEAQRGLVIEGTEPIVVIEHEIIKRRPVPRTAVIRRRDGGNGKRHMRTSRRVLAAPTVADPLCRFVNGVLHD